MFIYSLQDEKAWEWLKLDKKLFSVCNQLKNRAKTYTWYPCTEFYKTVAIYVQVSGKSHRAPNMLLICCDLANPPTLLFYSF